MSCDDIPSESTDRGDRCDILRQQVASVSVHMRGKARRFVTPSISTPLPAASCSVLASVVLIHFD